MSVTLRILYTGGFELPDKNAAAHRVVSNGKIFRELGHQVYFIGISKDRDIKTHEIKETKSDFEGFEYYSYPYPQNNTEWIKYICTIPYISMIEEICPDIIIAYNYPAIALAKLRYYCKRKGIKILGDVTEWYQPEGNLLFKFIKSVDTNLRMRVIHKKMDGLILISKYLYQYYGYYMDNIIEVPPLVDLSQEKWRDDLDNNDIKSINLVFAGTQGQYKDRVETLVNIICRINKKKEKQIILTIVGLDKESFIKNYSPDDNMKEMLDQFVIFKGRLSHAESISEIKRNDFHIFIRDNNLTNKAGFPTKFVESIACGTPVITNLSGNIGDYLKDGENGIIIDVESKDLLISSVSGALSVTGEQIRYMKTQCRESDVFDFHKYILPFKSFLSDLKE